MKSLRPDCFDCQQMLGIGQDGWRCAAFEAIPVEILTRQRMHTTPYEGDHGVHFEKKKTQVEANYFAVSKDEMRCEQCKFYIIEGGCRTVEGEISPLGWCSGYVNASGEHPMGQVRTDSSEFKDVERGNIDLSDHTELLPAAGIMICTRDGKVLLLKRSDSGQWAFPGGKIEEGETSEEAALRECEEEIGLRPDNIRDWTRRSRDGVDFTTYLSLVDDEFEPKLNEEHTEFRWLPADDLGVASMRELGL